MKIYNMEKIHKGIKNPPIEFIKVLQERLSYDSDTGIITWKNGINTGKEAGAITTTFVRKYDNAKHSVRQIYIGGYVLLGHRVAWAMYYGSFPNNIIDHIDNDSLNNRIENLRDVTSWENSMNRRVPSGRNQHGVKNVHVYDGRRKMYGVVIRGKASKGKGSGLEIRKQFYRLRHAIEFRNKELKKLNLPYEEIDRNEWLTNKPIAHVKLDKTTKPYTPKHKSISESKRNKIREVAETRQYCYDELQEKFNISKCRIAKIVKGIKIPHKKIYDVKKMIELAKTEKYTRKELSNIFNISYTTISTDLRENNIKLKSVNERLEENKDKISALIVEQKYTNQQLSSLFNCSTTAIYLFLKKHELKARRKKCKKYEHTEEYYRKRPWLSQQ